MIMPPTPLLVILVHIDQQRPCTTHNWQHSHFRQAVSVQGREGKGVGSAAGLGIEEDGKIKAGAPGACLMVDFHGIIEAPTCQRRCPCLQASIAISGGYVGTIQSHSFGIDGFEELACVWSWRHAALAGRARRDKNGSPVASQALVRAWVSPCRLVGTRAAQGILSKDSSADSGTVWISSRSRLICASVRRTYW